MSSAAFQRMRIRSHAYIKRQIAFSKQRLKLISEGDRRRRTCYYSAHSAFLLCAVNPSGPCEGCPHYQPDWQRTIELDL